MQHGAGEAAALPGEGGEQRKDHGEGDHEGGEGEVEEGGADGDLSAGQDLDLSLLLAQVQQPPMRKLGVMMLFQWYAMSGYWGYVIYAIGRSVYATADAHSSAFHSAVLTNGEVAAFYNAISFLSAFAMVPLARRNTPTGSSRWTRFGVLPSCQPRRAVTW